MYTAGDPIVIARGLPPASANEFIRRMLDLLIRQSLSAAAKELNTGSRESIVPVYGETM